jgi:hypothetical protein
MHRDTSSGLALMSALLAALVMTAAPAGARAGPDSKNISDGAAKGQATEGVVTAPHCPAGEVPVAGGASCAKPAAINYNASKSNTGNRAVTVVKTHDSASPN